MKLRLLDPHDRLVLGEDLPPIADVAGRTALDRALRELEGVDAIGHRFVHGGLRLSESVLIDEAVERELQTATDLAPVHQPLSLTALAAVSDRLPRIPQVACFDTAFHSGLPAEASTYAIPPTWREEYGARRFGFHGLSHAYAARRAVEMDGRPGRSLRVVTCHLGAGSSLAAVRNLRSVDTTMGFTPLEGLVMATRSGTVDPGLLLWLQRNKGLSVDDVSDALEHSSGLLGLAGTADMRDALSAAEGGDAPARLAIDVYVHRLCAAVAAMTASLGGIDVLVFTGGVGENAWRIREMAVDRLAFLGARIDLEKNLHAEPDGDLTAPGASVRCSVVRAREDLEIAREVRRTVLGRP